jgi:hypothetical protein
MLLVLQAVALKIELEREHVRGTNVLKNMNNRVKQLQKQIHDFREQYIQYTQVTFLAFLYMLQFPCWWGSRLTSLPTYFTYSRTGSAVILIF